MVETLKPGVDSHVTKRRIRKEGVKVGWIDAIDDVLDVSSVAKHCVLSAVPLSGNGLEKLGTAKLIDFILSSTATSTFTVKCSHRIQLNPNLLKIQNFPK